jgi:hypothetical protein
MKKTFIKTCALVGTATLLTTPSLFAALIGSGDLTISAPGLSSGDVDGPYSVVTTSVASGQNLGNFSTFCIGSQVDYYSGGSYAYQISTSVQPFADGTAGGLSYISLGTAWLFNQYTTGALGDGSKNDAVNNAIQMAFWYLQGQQAGGQNNIYVTDAMNAISGMGGNYLANANGAWGVYALDMSPTNGTGLAPGDAYNYAQPELCQIPGSPGFNGSPVIPEPSTVFAASLLLLPLGVSVLRIVRRKSVMDQ